MPWQTIAALSVVLLAAVWFAKRMLAEYRIGSKPPQAPKSCCGCGCGGGCSKRPE